MLEVGTAKAVIEREYDAFIARVEAADDDGWRSAVRCEGWTVRDLAMHVASGQAVEAEALERMVEGSMAPASLVELDPSSDRATIEAAVRQARSRLGAALATVTPENAGGICPMPYGPFPGMLALQIFVLEAGLHVNDLAWALGDRVPLPSDVIEGVSGLLPLTLPFLASQATQSPEVGTGYVFNGSSKTLRLAYGPKGWEVDAEADGPVVTISGEDTSVFLFMLGRIPVDGPGLTVTGDANLAAAFKTYFPGP